MNVGLTREDHKRLTILAAELGTVRCSKSDLVRRIASWIIRLGQTPEGRQKIHKILADVKAREEAERNEENDREED